jgi:hypothetical protein
MKTVEVELDKEIKQIDNQIAIARRLSRHSRTGESPWLLRHPEPSSDEPESGNAD